MTTIVLTAGQAAVGPWPRGTRFYLQGREWEEIGTTPTRIRLWRLQQRGASRKARARAGSLEATTTVTTFRRVTKYVATETSLEVRTPD